MMNPRDCNGLWDEIAFVATSPTPISLRCNRPVLAAVRCRAADRQRRHQAAFPIPPLPACRGSSFRPIFRRKSAEFRSFTEKPSMKVEKEPMSVNNHRAIDSPFSFSLFLFCSSVFRVSIDFHFGV